MDRRIQSNVRRIGIGKAGMQSNDSTVDADANSIEARAGGMVTTDEVVKGAIMNYVFKHLEVASYTSLIAAADRCGDALTKAAESVFCRRNKRWPDGCSSMFHAILVAYLERSASGVEAKKGARAIWHKRCSM
jgi:hypothetical protein